MTRLLGIARLRQHCDIQQDSRLHRLEIRRGIGPACWIVILVQSALEGAILAHDVGLSVPILRGSNQIISIVLQGLVPTPDTPCHVGKSANDDGTDNANDNSDDGVFGLTRDSGTAAVVLSSSVETGSGSGRSAGRSS